MTKSKALMTLDGQSVDILYEGIYTSLLAVLQANRHIENERFFSPDLSDLHDPFLMPDMEKAVKRILEARERSERVVIFGDYDVDGVSSTAILFRFLREIGIEVSYRLPHRVHDGYGLKSYFFDELAEKNVKLVITVDCGTRDIEPIRHAKSLGIDVIVTDHHAVPDIIPEEVIAILNPKRKDSLYPFPNLAGAGVAFKLLHALAITIAEDTNTHTNTAENIKTDTTVSSVCVSVSPTLQRYIDLASLGTVADCMPLVGENRIITALGLRQMKNSTSSALRKYIENLDREVDGDADIIGFQIGPRINAAGRMDSPLKALHWLLATEDRVDSWLEEVESLNAKRQEEVKIYTEDALQTVDTEAPILFYKHEDIAHGIIGLVAGRLTETYGKPSIVLCKQHHNPKNEPKKREYEAEMKDERGKMKDDTGSHLDGDKDHPENLESGISNLESYNYVASCRSPEWCHLVELLDECKEYFVRYGGHRQAAGFTIEASKLEAFQGVIGEKFRARYGIENLPKKTLRVECAIKKEDISLETLDMIDRFRPFGIGNPKPLFLLKDVTLSEMKYIGQEKNHISLSFSELPGVRFLLWNFSELFGDKHPSPNIGDILTIIISLERNTWNGKSSVQGIIKNIIP